MIYQSTHEMILDDVFLDLSGFISGVNLLLKVEGFNPAGSIKMKAAVGLVEDAEDRGLLRPGGHVIESSSGNLGIALSSVCAARGYRFTCVVDPNTSAHSIALMRAYGAEVVSVDQRDENGGFLQSRIDYIHRRIAADPSLVWPNQYANPANPRAHYERTAAAIVKQGIDIDYLFVGAGTTGTLMGCIAYFRENSPRTKVIAVDTVGSVTFGNPPARRHIPGLGTSRRPEILDPERIEHVVMVPEAEAVHMCRVLAGQRGIAAGGSTGSVLAAVERQRAEIPSGAQVVAIAPDLGDRYLGTIYDDAWVRERFGADAAALPGEGGVHRLPGEGSADALPGPRPRVPAQSCRS